jgi:hypothetical protein
MVNNAVFADQKVTLIDLVEVDEELLIAHKANR